jgi:ATP-dependent helicase HrpB
LARLGAHPRLAGILLAAGIPAVGALAAYLAALLEERDPLRAPMGRSQRADPPADIALRLAALRGAAAGDLDRAALAAIRRGAASYRRRLRLPADALSGGDPAPLLAQGFPDRIAQRRSEPGSFRLSGGGGARLAETDALARAPLLVVPTLALQAAPRIRLAAALDPAALTTILAHQIQESQESGIDPASGAVLLRRRRRLGVLVLEDRTERAPPAFAAACLAEAADLAALPWSLPARQLQARVGLLHALEPTNWPDLSDAALAADKAAWLVPALLGCARLADLATPDMAAILAARLDVAQRRRLDRLLPEALDLPGGRAAIDYTQPVPQAAARAQAFYGLAETPRLAEGRMPLRLALLSPAGRPMAITADLAGFWRGAWAEVRREMRGRYPKHRWPEDPLQPR